MIGVTNIQTYHYQRVMIWLNVCGLSRRLQAYRLQRNFAGRSVRVLVRVIRFPCHLWHESWSQRSTVHGLLEGEKAHNPTVISFNPLELPAYDRRRDTALILQHALCVAMLMIDGAETWKRCVHRYIAAAYLFQFFCCIYFITTAITIIKILKRIFVALCYATAQHRQGRRERLFDSVCLSVRSSRAGHSSKLMTVRSYGFCRAILCISAAYAVMRCLSVRPSACLCVCHVRGSCQNQ